MLACWRALAKQRYGVDGRVFIVQFFFFFFFFFFPYSSLSFFLFFCSMNTNGHREKSTSGGRLSFGRLASGRSKDEGLILAYFDLEN